MNEKEELLHDLKAVYGELFPHRDAERIPVDDATLTLGVLLRREMHTLLARKLPSGNAHGLDSQVTAKPKPKGRKPE